jgi:hypothetical protein
LVIISVTETKTLTVSGTKKSFLQIGRWITAEKEREYEQITNTIFKSVLFKQEKERITVGGGRRQRWSLGLCWWRRDVEMWKKDSERFVCEQLHMFSLLILTNPSHWFYLTVRFSSLTGEGLIPLPHLRQHRYITQNLWWIKPKIYKTNIENMNWLNKNHGLIKT